MKTDTYLDRFCTLRCYDSTIQTYMLSNANKIFQWRNHSVFVPIESRQYSGYEPSLESKGKRVYALRDGLKEYMLCVTVLRT